MAEKEYIERKAATAYAPLPKYLRDYQTMNLDDAWEDGYDFAIKQIEAIPAADVRPVVRGKWNRTDAYPHRVYCSVCYKTYLKNDELLERWEFPMNFCPNCGADMRTEEGET